MVSDVYMIDLAETFPHLASSPVVEAVIHWAARAENWPNESALREELACRVPGNPHITKRLRFVEAELQLCTDGSASHSIDKEDWHGLRLVSEDKLFVIQFTRFGLAFSRLQPYRNWEDFSQAALVIWKLFVEIANPAEVQRLGVRFINRMDIRDVADVKRFLSQPPECLSEMNLPSESFMYQSAHRVPGQPYGINITRTVTPTATAGAQALSLIVDIDAFTDVPVGVGETDSVEHLRRLRWLKDKAFFSLMSDEALIQFAKNRGDE